MKKMICLMLLTIAVAGCQKNRNNDPVKNAEEASKDRDLQKTFVSECSLKPIDAILSGLLTAGQSSIKSSETSYRFDGANVIRQARLFTSADCTGDAAVVFEEAGTIKIDGSDRRTNDHGREIEMDYKSVVVTIPAEENAKAANTASLCGISNWKAGDQRDVTAQAKETLCYNAAVPRHVSNIYRVDDGVLYFGTLTKGSVSVKERPSSLDKLTKFNSK